MMVIRMIDTQTAARIVGRAPIFTQQRLPLIAFRHFDGRPIRRFGCDRRWIIAVVLPRLVKAALEGGVLVPGGSCSECRNDASVRFAGVPILYLFPLKHQHLTELASP